MRLLWFKNMERDDGAGVGLDLGYSPSHANEELIAWHKHMEGLFAELADTALSTDGPNVDPFRPEVIADTSQSVDQILATLQRILSNIHFSQTFPPFFGVGYPPSQITRLFALGEMLTAELARTMDRARFDALTYHVNASTIHWLHDFLRLPPTTKGYYRATRQRARLLLAKLALARKFPSYPVRGFLGFGDNVLPVLFATHEWSWLEELRYDLGLPAQSIRIFPDVETLTAALSELETPIVPSPSKMQLRPFLILASVGGGPVGGASMTDHFYSTDQLTALVDVATKHKVWLHLEGTGLWLRAMKDFSSVINQDTPMEIKDDLQRIANAVSAADSVMLNALTLFGFQEDNQCIPTVFFRSDKFVAAPPEDFTEYSNSDYESTSSVSNVNESPKEPSKSTSKSKSSNVPWVPIEHGLPTLPLWITLQFVGKVGMREDFTSAWKLAQHFREAVDNIPSLEILTPPLALNVIFRYVPLSNNDDEVSKSGEAASNGTQSESLFSAPSFVSTVNEQVLMDIRHTQDAVVLDLDLAIVNGTAWIKFDPYASSNLDDMATEAIDLVVDNLSLETELIDSTLQQRDVFENAIRAHPAQNVVVAPLPRFIGLGGARCYPSVLLPLPADRILGPSLQKEVNDFNEAVVCKLQEGEDSHVFKATKDSDGRVCVAVGVNASPMTKEFALRCAQRIIEAVNSVEDKVNFSQRLDSILVSNIEEAKKKMKSEFEKSQGQQSVFRKLPIVGSVYNWWSPAPTEIAGSSFDIIETTLSAPRISKPTPADAVVARPPPDKIDFPSSSSEEIGGQTSESGDVSEVEELQHFAPPSKTSDSDRILL